MRRLWNCSKNEFWNKSAKSLVEEILECVCLMNQQALIYGIREENEVDGSQDGKWIFPSTVTYPMTEDRCAFYPAPAYGRFAAASDRGARERRVECARGIHPSRASRAGTVDNCTQKWNNKQTFGWDNEQRFPRNNHHAEMKKRNMALITHLTSITSFGLYESCKWYLARLTILSIGTPVLVSM